MSARVIDKETTMNPARHRWPINSDKPCHDPFSEMPADMSEREFDLLLRLVFALEHWLCNKYEHLLGPDLSDLPSADYPPPDDADDNIPW